jgi:hypothetical protein
MILFHDRQKGYKSSPLVHGSIIVEQRWYRGAVRLFVRKKEMELPLITTLPGL